MDLNVSLKLSLTIPDTTTSAIFYIYKCNTINAFEEEIPERVHPNPHLQNSLILTLDCDSRFFIAPWSISHSEQLLPTDLVRLHVCIKHTQTLRPQDATQNKTEGSSLFNLIIFSH